MSNTRSAAVAKRDNTAQAFYRESPFPPPQECVAFEEILPGSTERIFAMTEKEQEFRHSITKDALIKEYALGRLGLHYTMTFGLGGLGTSIYLFSIGMNWEGIGVLVTEMIAGMYAFHPRGNGNGKKPHPEHDK